MSDVTIKYKGQSIATMDASGTKTLGTQGKYCEGDIDVEYVKPAGPTGTKQISITANGTTTEDVTNYASAEITVDVQGSSDYVASDWFDMAKPTGAVSFSGNSFNDAAIRGRTGITSVSIPNVKTIGGPFSNCTGLTSVYAPLLQSAGTDAFRSTKVEYAVFPALTKIGTNGFLFDTSLKAADFGGEAEGTGLGNAVFSGCTQMNLLILRGSVLWPLNNVGTFNNSPFASGKAGGTIYIPKSLYDHLGDGGSYDYQAATNWSTVYGYGTITWAKIEGSYYETHYADGTAIPSS